jgi:hypothetical protein
MYALGRIGKVIVFSARRGPIYAQLLTGIIRQTALPPAPAGGIFWPEVLDVLGSCVCTPGRMDGTPSIGMGAGPRGPAFHSIAPCI